MSKRQSRYRYWWYQIVVDMIRNYNSDHENDGELVKKFNTSISEAFEELKDKEYGEETKKAIYMVHIDRTHTTCGSAIALNISKRTLERQISNFVYRVGELSGLK